MALGELVIILGILCFIAGSAAGILGLALFVLKKQKKPNE